MQSLDPRIKNALVSIDPTTKNSAWHGCPTAIGVLRGVNSAVAVWRPYPEANNIREIGLHIAFWENSVANRLSDKRVRLELEQWKTGWIIRSDEVEEKQWKSEIELIKEVHGRLVEAVMHFDPDMLDQPAGKQTARNAIEFIHGVAEHRLYHTAQMEMIKTLAKLAGVK
jgi:hypothetical protein